MRDLGPKPRTNQRKSALTWAVRIFEPAVAQQAPRFSEGEAKAMVLHNG